EGRKDETHRQFIEAVFLADQWRRGRDVDAVKIGDEVHDADHQQHVPTAPARTCRCACGCGGGLLEHRFTPWRSVLACALRCAVSLAWRSSNHPACLCRDRQARGAAWQGTAPAAD